MRPTLFIVAKAPIMGRAKTRLAADIGPVHAKRIYRSMMSQVLHQTRDPKWDTVLAVTPPHLLGHVPDWEGFEQIPQYVFGPASDGGFWLMGAKGPLQRGFFDGVRWSHAQTLSDVKARTGDDYAELRTLTDVDDLKALRLMRRSRL